MITEKFTMKDLQQLDDISYDEVDRIIGNYESIRCTLARWLNAMGENAIHDPNAYEKIDSRLSDLPQSKAVKKYRAILEQMRDENCYDDSN